MSHSIDIVTESLATNLNEFQSDMNKMETLLGEIKASTSRAKSSWKGSASDSVIGGLETFQQVFEQVTAQNKKYIAFLNTVIERYIAEDDSEKSSMESNASSYTVTGIGR